MIVFRGRSLWNYVSLLAFMVYTSRCSYLYDDCTVKKDYEGVVIKTFRDSLRVTIANTKENDKVAIINKGKRKTLAIPKNKWTEIECRVSSNDEVECEEMSNTAEKKNSGGPLKEFTLKNAEVLANCPQGLPNKELTSDTSIDFPRWKSTREHFAIIPEENLTVSLSIFGQNLSLCWNGKQTVVKTSKEDCQALPAHKVHKITLDYELQEIKSADGRFPIGVNSTNANKDDLMKMKSEGGKAWVVQSRDDWTHLQDQDQSTGSQTECICDHGGNTEVILSLFLLFFIITTIALCCYLLRIRRNSSRSRSSPASQVLELNTAKESMTNENPGSMDYGEESENDIYGYNSQGH
ncbi:uncharacterized protein LOC125046056 [Penaeus chinensis]|uniref:uncharacterized protein LOC125046056 n=1 Tax=Penaeus chinensis TaxID=139456 RepID=UPI001FB7C761|nr:uncharacterized protein LOC125046056 [Penaeus chinensis]